MTLPTIARALYRAAPLFALGAAFFLVGLWIGAEAVCGG